MGVPMKKTTKPLTVRQQYKKDYDRLFKEIGRDGGLWSQAVHAIHGHKCAICGLPSQAAHHFFGKKAYPSVRFNLDNSVACCKGCHSIKIHLKGQTELARDALISRIGQDRFDKVKKLANEVARFTLDDLIAIKEELLAHLKGKGVGAD